MEFTVKSVFCPLVTGVLWLLLVGCAQTPTAPQITIDTLDITALQEVDNQITALNRQYGATNVLVVTDIDNTVLTATADLGSDIWYQWQTGKLDVQPTPQQQVDCLYEDAIGLLYALAPMQLTEPAVPALLASWQQQGNPVIALTARGPATRAATERELARYQLDFAQNPIRGKHHEPLLLRDTLEREYSYMKGIMMTSGQNKGVMLQRLIKQADQHYKAIVFIDDSAKNIANMVNAYEQTGDTSVYAYYYTLVEHQRLKENGAIITSEQAAAMTRQYQQLTNVIRSIYPARPTDGQCLGQ
ncbi:DUF2608 domain-containing protein [Salinimonas sediminis]|uniref:DUF2608 domain-containing protein n=1 Tax=Salinimonas sediminis TaxID=2303538 RepID=A0A346NHU4_9ALTE|nr:DUF2608 domain-containing protein [Salinimonas sediminis]